MPSLDTALPLSDWMPLLLTLINQTVGQHVSIDLKQAQLLERCGAGA
jgi:hypothetical protein